MEGLNLKCPLCCDKIFDSKELLLEHLTTILENLSCPICNSKWSTLVHLTEHLSIDNCQNSLSTKSHSHELNDIRTSDTVTNIITENPNEPIENQLSVMNNLDGVENGEVSKMYVELLGKQLLKPCLQTQELKLIKHDGGSHYVILTQPNVELNMENTVVTKQNNDGTISLTTMKDLKLESETLIAPTEPEPSSEDNTEELYSCNTCGVSFSSVLDHIQNYHNDQEVVVEEPVEENESDMHYKITIEDEASDKMSSRRVITDTGDIVEASSMTKTSVQEATPVTTSVADKVTSQSNRVYATRFVQIDNLCDSVVKDIKESDDKNVNCHKVVVKELKTQVGPSVKMYHCTVCMIYVSNLNEFKTQACKTLEYSCPQCPVVYGNSKSLHAHMKVHKPKTEGTPEQPVSYECAVCCTVFPTNKSLKLHKRMHDPLKVRPIELPVENKDGSEVTNSKYLCPICNKLIPIDYRTVHQNSHKTSNMYNCSICNKKFTSNEYLDMHMNVHNIDKVTVSKQDKSLPYNCLYCNRRFARPHEKVKHERIHTGEKPHSCEICGKSFRVSYCLTLHMRTHTGARPYACAHCGKRFKAHSVYNHHLLTHSDVRNYKCPYCPKAFKTSVQLAGHKNSHTKPFSCQHCNRPFASLYAVRVHTETHLRHNNLNFSCSLCGASYARAFALKDHVRLVHNQDVDAHDVQDPTEHMVSKDEAWASKTDNMDSVSKEFSTEASDLGMSNNELMSP